jgi:16S rRNA (cytidine1402-2'-O)-methyltransferase
MLYIVPTPIGNLKDITLRALEVLRDVDMILAEDTRVSGKLLHHYEISKPLLAYHDHNEHQILKNIIEKLKSGMNIALISDAGTPLISDPGFLLVRECMKNEIQVIPLPGASALTTALSASGLPTDKFHFEGFLPHKKGRNKRWDFLQSYPGTLIFYESPHRLLKLLIEIQDKLGSDTMITVAKEISKIYEEFRHGKINEIIGLFHDDAKFKGEYVVLAFKVNIE